jgi:hypothetical protein
MDPQRDVTQVLNVRPGFEYTKELEALGLVITVNWKEALKQLCNNEELYNKFHNNISAYLQVLRSTVAEI